MWAMIEKLRIRLWSIKSGKYRERQSARRAFFQQAPELVAHRRKQRELLAGEQQPAPLRNDIADNRGRDVQRGERGEHAGALRRGDQQRAARDEREGIDREVAADGVGDGTAWYRLDPHP